MGTGVLGLFFTSSRQSLVIHICIVDSFWAVLIVYND